MKRARDMLDKKELKQDVERWNGYGVWGMRWNEHIAYGIWHIKYRCPCPFSVIRKNKINNQHGQRSLLTDLWFTTSNFTFHCFFKDIIYQLW